jgi:uncharacterized LabA/DUF88 family protein
MWAKIGNDMQDRGFFVIDGSRLFSSIHEIWRTRPDYSGKRLKLDRLSEALIRKWAIYTGPTTRVVYYFKKRDARITTMLEVPDSEVPGMKDHWQIKECGESIKSIPEQEIQKVDPKYRDQFHRAEKGLDTKLACDALISVATGKASNIVFLVNDRDFIPVLDAIQYLGGNTYLTALDSTQNIQKGLSNLADKYLTLDDEMPNIFGVRFGNDGRSNLIEQTDDETKIIDDSQVQQS